MSEVARWFGRRFDFGFPVELYPNVCVRLLGTPARLEEMVLRVARPVLTRRPGEGKWSAQEHVGHLLDLEGLWMARVQDFLGSGEALTAADLTNRQTDEARHNSVEIVEILEKFRLARGRLVERVSALDAGRFSRELVHPRLKQPMRLVDHLYFVAEHDDHHLARIWEMTGRSGE